MRGFTSRLSLTTAEFLQDLPRLWLHPGVTHEEREALVKQVFQQITIDGKDFVDVEPKREYAPLFATRVTGQKVGYRETDSSPSPRPLSHISQLDIVPQGTLLKPLFVPVVLSSVVQC
jgi:hypothetical protein